MDAKLACPQQCVSHVSSVTICLVQLVCHALLQYLAVYTVPTQQVAWFALPGPIHLAVFATAVHMHKQAACFAINHLLHNVFYAAKAITQTMGPVINV